MNCPVCASVHEEDICPICATPAEVSEDAGKWYEMGRDHWKEGRFGWASRALERALEIDDGMLKGWIALGIARRDSGEFLTALECFDRAIEIDPGDDKAYYNKALTLSKYGIHRDALRMIDEGISRGGGLVLLLAKGDALMEVKRYEEALEAYDSALKLNPQYKVTLFSRQRCLEAIEASRPRQGGLLSRRRQRRSQQPPTEGQEKEVEDQATVDEREESLKKKEQELLQKAEKMEEVLEELKRTTDSVRLREALLGKQNAEREAIEEPEEFEAVDDDPDPSKEAN